MTSPDREKLRDVIGNILIRHLGTDTDRVTGHILDALDRQSPIAPSDDEVVKRVLAAVRDEVGSRLCHWTGTKRVCTREGWASSVCLCEQAARAAITAVGGAP